MSKILNYIKYSGCTITLKLNPFHWRLRCEMYRTNEMWEQDFFYMELLPITIKLWIDDGSW